MSFPRGWTLPALAQITAAAVNVPGIPGVVHVLDSVTATMYGVAGAAGPFGPEVLLNSSDGVYVNFPLGILFWAAAPASDSLTVSGLDLAAGPGASMTVTFQAAGTGITEYLLAQGHDV